MSRRILSELPVPLMAVCSLVSLAPSVIGDEPGAAGAAADAQQAATVDVDSLVAAVQERVAGREAEPAEAVFEDIRILKGVPAGRVPMIMKFGFSRSLGVDCTHCHDVDDFASNARSEKQVAREMWAFSAQVNELLRSVPGLDSEQPVVNCTTCHRGDTKPATNMR